MIIIKNCIKYKNNYAKHKNNFLDMLIVCIPFFSNEVKNTFVTQTSYNNVYEIIFKGACQKTQEESIPEILDFDLLFEDTNKLNLLLQKKKEME